MNLNLPGGIFVVTTNSTRVGNFGLKEKQETYRLTLPLIFCLIIPFQSGCYQKSKGNTEADSEWSSQESNKETEIDNTLPFTHASTDIDWQDVDDRQGALDSETSLLATDSSLKPDGWENASGAPFFVPTSICMVGSYPDVQVEIGASQREQTLSIVVSNIPLYRGDLYETFTLIKGNTVEILIMFNTGGILDLTKCDPEYTHLRTTLSLEENINIEHVKVFTLFALEDVNDDSEIGFVPDITGAPELVGSADVEDGGDCNSIGEACNDKSDCAPNYPSWATEYGCHYLSSCDANACLWDSELEWIVGHIK